MAVLTVARPSAAFQIAEILDSPEVSALVAELDGLRWTGRKGYGPRALVGACLVKTLYAIPTWTRTAALIAEHAALQGALGGCPSVYVPQGRAVMSQYATSNLTRAVVRDGDKWQEWALASDDRNGSLTEAQRIANLGMAAVKAHEEAYAAAGAEPPPAFQRRPDQQ